LELKFLQKLNKYHFLPVLSTRIGGIYAAFVVANCVFPIDLTIDVDLNNFVKEEENILNLKWNFRRAHFNVIIIHLI
jgi:hypothetical protein